MAGRAPAPEPDAPPGAPEAAPPPPVRVDEVWKVYREGASERAVLRGVSLRVEAGEIAVLLGRSGSGKSTLLNLIAGLDLPTRGAVHTLGRELTALRETERTRLRRGGIGFVFQAFNLVPTLTAEENVRLPLELAGVRARAAREAARETLARLGLEERGASLPDRLSGGEQQRVAIARALVHAPRLVLADEPTGNLDLETGRRVLAELDRLVRESGASLVMATHSPEVVGHADRVLRIRGGHLEDVSEAVSETVSEPVAVEPGA